MRHWKTATRYLFGVLFIIAGVNHFRNPDGFVRVMPPYLPWHLELVYLSGAAEIGLGAMLLFRRWMAVAGWGLIALLVAVFPANIQMALHPEVYPSAPVWVLWTRLPLQFLLIAWAWWYTRPDPAPRR